ncbi:2-nitropropane dioxygenase [Domibacillus antri]|uniref:Probable nitronate monooxygenase n=1 Tax=Domibacillus antri TaxID=1714264 RepID=A0A1Q8Q1S4_9BACI|nr:nitronate monooxygenase family protein [Domibacillus antri]OLN21280.1 2-nitropropane dioxygenase [Domibacillus antri]
MRNRISAVLDVSFPIIESGMAFIGDGTLAAAVSNAGGFGQVAAAGHSTKEFKKQIETASSLTNKPFGVNVPISRVTIEHEYFSIIYEYRHLLKAVSLGAGDPRPFIEPLKKWGLKVIAVGGTVKHAVNAETHGTDIFVCEGFEAGGRNSPYELTLFSLLPQVAKAVSLPVAAAGGIVDGKGVLAAFSLGAEGVQMGTRFIASKESPAHAHYKKRLVETTDTDTVILERSIERINRVIRDKLPNEILSLEKAPTSFEELYPYINGLRNKAAAIDGNLEDGWLHTGQSAGLIDSIDSVEDIIQNVMKELKTARQKESVSIKGV